MDFYFVDASGKEIQNITKYSKQTRRPDVTAARGIEGNYKLPLKRVYNYNWSGFKLEIDIDNIINDIVNLEQVFIKVVITIGNVVRTKQLSTSRGYKARPKYRMFNDCMIYPKYDSLSNLFLETSKVSGLVNDVQIVGNELIFTIDSNSAETDKLKIGLVNYELKNVQYANLILNNKTHITASFDVSKIKWTEDGNSFYGYIYIGQKKQPLIFDRKLIDKQIYYNQNEMFLLNHGAKGNMGIFVQKITPFMKKVELKTKKVKLVVEILKTIKAPLQSYQLIIKIGDVSKKIEPILMEHNNIINLTYYFNLEDCEKLLLDSGAARIYVEYNCEELPIKITKEGFDSLNIIVKGIKHNFYRDNNILRYRVTSNWDWIDRGPRRQDVIKKIVYPIFKKLPIKKNLTVFSAYWGTKYDCNPRALYEYIDKVSDKHKTVWFLNKQFTEVPGNAIVVKTGSIRYYYYLARANFLVNNVNFPDIYEKRKKAIEIQTMHGTPLKKIGLDSEELKFQKQKEQYINRSKRWDYLTVPSKYVAKISKSAYQSDAEILAVGYPRNDKLFNFDKKNIEQIKERIGVPKNKKIIFYAPTWRTRGVFMLPFNIKQMKEKLENEYILVVKIHHFTKLYKNEDIDSNFVFDLSDYDDIRDLYLISDMLITDYSSVMFDYATLKKPMLFYTYDYDLYKNELRGMYIDFKAEAPGPLIENTQDLLKEISIINKYEKRYKKNIQKFRKKYIMYDDGSSSRKIYENIFN